MLFMNDWKFCKDGGEVQIVDLPHDAMLLEKRTYKTPNGDKTGFYPGGKYIYEKDFSLSEQEADEYVALKFHGIYGRSEIILNGEKVCSHAYGYTEFTVDFTGKCRAGNNTVRVIVDNTLAPNSRWYSGSGIYRTVELIKKNRVHLENIRITTVSINPTVINVSCNDEGARVTILDRSESEVFKGNAGNIEIPGAKLWSAESPYLYTCKIETKNDCELIKFGIRYLTWSSKEGLKVNGKQIKLRGGCIHHDNGVLGACAFRDAEYRKIRILKDAGYNAIRCSHNPCSKELLEACDEIGMYVLDEAFDGWYTPKNYHDYSRDFRDCYRDDLEAMVLRDYSHPSVIMYSIGNEVTEIANDEGIEFAGNMARLVKELDATRPVTCGINIMLVWLAQNGNGLYKDDGKYEAKPLPDVADGRPKAGSEFFNALMQKLGSVMSFQTKTKKSGKIVDSIADEFDILGLNYGQRRYDIELKNHPERILLGSETLVEDLSYNWDRVQKNNALIGDFCWTAMDYIGEAGLGAWRHESETEMPYLAGSGAIDITGIPNAENAYQRVIWGIDDIAIGVRPVHLSGEKLMKKQWSFTDACSSWNWKWCNGRRAVVEVYSRAKVVELLLNNKSIGKKKPKNNRCIFKCDYHPGNLLARGYDESGILIAETGLTSGRGEAHLRLRAEKETLKADGTSLCYMFAEAVDDDGIICPASEDEICVSVTGNAVLQGIGTARAYSDISFGEAKQKLYRGRCQIVLKATDHAGEAIVRVSQKDKEDILKKIRFE